jgi:FtsH-binding integral membrane protein
MAQFQTRPIGATAGLAIDQGLRAHMNSVYSTMSIGMLVTAGVSWAVGTSPALLMSFINPANGHLNILGWVITFLPLVMVMAFSAALPRLSVGAAQLFFYAYAAAMGLSLSFIFAIYTGASIFTTFLATAASFAGLSLYGYTTKKNLSGMGSFLMMGLVGILVAMIVNIFLASSALQFAISVIGVLILSLIHI